MVIFINTCSLHFWPSCFGLISLWPYSCTISKSSLSPNTFNFTIHPKEITIACKNLSSFFFLKGKLVIHLSFILVSFMNFRFMLWSYKNSAFRSYAQNSAEPLNHFGKNRYLYLPDFFLCINTYFTFLIYFSMCHFKNEILFMFSHVYFQLVDFLLLSAYISCSANKKRCLSKGFLPYFIAVILALLFLPVIGCASFLDFSKSYHKQRVLLFLFSKAIIYIFHCLTLLAEIHPASLSSCEDMGIFFLLLTLNGRLLMLHC